MSDQQIKILRVRIAELEKPVEGKDNNIDLLIEKVSTASEQYNNDNISLIRHQNLVSNFIKDKEFKDLKISELTLKTESDRQKLMSEDRERIDIEDIIIQLDQELQTFYLEKKNFQSTLGEAEQEYFKARNNIGELEDAIKNLNRSQAQLQQSIQSLKDQFTEQKFEIQSVGERLRLEFNVSINDVVNQEPKSDSDYHEIIKMVASLFGRTAKDSLLSDGTSVEQAVAKLYNRGRSQIGHGGAPALLEDTPIERGAADNICRRTLNRYLYPLKSYEGVDDATTFLSNLRPEAGGA